ADEERGYGDEESRNRPGDADVEQHPFERNRLTNADEGAQRAARRQRQRKKEWQRRIDVVIAAREVVAERVAAKDAQNRGAEPESAEQEPGKRLRPRVIYRVGERVVLQRADDGRRRDRQYEQENVKPEAISELRLEPGRKGV